MNRVKILFSPALSDFVCGTARVKMMASPFSSVGLLIAAFGES